jgi:hypothetical protein
MYACHLQELDVPASPPPLFSPTTMPLPPKLSRKPAAKAMGDGS